MSSLFLSSSISIVNYNIAHGDLRGAVWIFYFLHDANDYGLTGDIILGRAILEAATV